MQSPDISRKAAASNQRVRQCAWQSGLMATGLKEEAMQGDNVPKRKAHGVQRDGPLGTNQVDGVQWLQATFDQRNRDQHWCPANERHGAQLKGAFEPTQSRPTPAGRGRPTHSRQRIIEFRTILGAGCNQASSMKTWGLVSTTNPRLRPPPPPPPRDPQHNEVCSLCYCAPPPPESLPPAHARKQRRPPSNAQRRTWESPERFSDARTSGDRVKMFSDTARAQRRSASR
jgi:hypothetical protein